MNVFDVKLCLESMKILVDTREHPNAGLYARCDAFGCPYERRKLSYGDYAYNFTLPDGKTLYGEDNAVSVDADVVIERKQSLTELSGNLIQQKDRFEREFSRAKEAGGKVYLLVEDATMAKIYSGKYGTHVHPNAYTASLWAIIARHGIIGPIFCPKEITGKVIHDILYRELKERLEGGVYG